MIDRRQVLSASIAMSAAGLALPARAADGAVLRVAWLAGNPVQARVGADAKPFGPAVDLAEALGRQLGRGCAFTAVAPANAVLDRLRKGEADIAFVAYDPSRAEGVAFSSPYLMSLNRFAVAKASPITAQDQVDRPGVRVGASTNDSGGLYLQRTLKSAVFMPLPGAMDGALGQLGSTLEVVAGNGQRLADLQQAGGDFRILPGSFFGVPQTIAVRKDDAAMAARAKALVETMLQSGAVAASIKRWNLTGAEAAHA